MRLRWHWLYYQGVKELHDRLSLKLRDIKGRKLRHLAWLFDEPTVYKMLLRNVR